MASASKQNPSSSKPPRHPTPITASKPEEPQFRNPNSNNPSTSVVESTDYDGGGGSDPGTFHVTSTHLTRPELLRRRSHYLKQLARCYIDHYGQAGDEIECSRDNDNNNGGADLSLSGNCVACGSDCKSKAMALTNYCQLHILMDKKPKLYTSCTYVTKRFLHNLSFPLAMNF